jgi:hypothetical protein
MLRVLRTRCTHSFHKSLLEPRIALRKTTRYSSGTVEAIRLEIDKGQLSFILKLKSYRHFRASTNNMRGDVRTKDQILVQVGESEISAGQTQHGMETASRVAVIGTSQVIEKQSQAILFFSNAELPRLDDREK